MQQLYDSEPDTRAHINVVRSLLTDVIQDLERRAVAHDASKLRPPEKEAFDRYTPLLATTTYGSDAYWDTLAAMRQALYHHYGENRHHPEHFTSGVNGMNLLDVIEMLCDWRAATQRHNDGDIMDSLEKNRVRFKIDDQLYQILKNTVLYMRWADSPAPGEGGV